MNRVDVVDIVVDLVDLDFDVDLVDVDLAVSLCDGPRSVLFSFGLVAPTCFICFWPRRELIFRGLVRQQYHFPAVFPASLYKKIKYYTHWFGWGGQPPPKSHWPLPLVI